MANPFDYIKSIYAKDRKITFVSEQWIPIYLNKTLIQDKDNAEAIEKAIEYCLYLSPTNYFYLLYLLIPGKLSYRITPIKKIGEPEVDALVEKVKYILGYSNKEYELNRRQIEKTILKDREFWESELAVTNIKKRTKK
jgi:hypothetical protein